MPLTPLLIQYPASSEHTRLWEHLQNLATTADTALTAVVAAAAGTLTQDTSNSAGFTTTEVVTDTITVALVAGKRYKIAHDASWSSTVGGDGTLIRIREDTLVGTALQAYRVLTSVAAAAYAGHIEGFYVAVATGNKTFVATSVRSGGTGTITRVGSAAGPSNLYVQQFS
jgi:hypothetical protein